MKTPKLHRLAPYEKNPAFGLFEGPLRGVRAQIWPGESDDVFRKYIVLEIDTGSGLQAPERGHLERVRDEHDFEPIVPATGNRQAHAVNRDRALLDDQRFGIARLFKPEGRSPRLAGPRNPLARRRRHAPARNDRRGAHRLGAAARD